MAIGRQFFHFVTRFDCHMLMNSSALNLLRFLSPVLLVLIFQFGGAAEEAKPNFLIIIGDDVGYDAFGCTGSEFARTPNIDKLAGEGLVFDRFYGTVSQCAPIRAELYTGLFPVNNGKLANAKSITKQGVKSIVDHLMPLGYDIGLSGKSHFNKGGKFQKIGGFPSGANSSVAEYSVDGLKTFIEKSKAADRSFCAVIGSIHAHHPWDLGELKNFDQASLDLPGHWIDTPGARDALRAAFRDSDHRIRAAVLDHAPDLTNGNERIAALVSALEGAV
mgnify:CR=1 FL=1